MSTSGTAHHVYRFGEFTLDVERCALMNAGADVPLRPKVFEVLRFLVEHHGHVVSKDELLSAVWSPAIVTEDSVTQCMMELRRALDDRDQIVVRTLPRRGYLFDAPVRGPDDAASEVQSGAPRPMPLRNRSGRSRRSIYLATIASLLLAAWWVAANHREIAPVPPAMSSSDATTPSIAVLPFTDMSPGGDQGYLADGIAEEIIDRLVRIPGLRVIARTSSFSFKGREANIGEIVARLGVDHVIEGSVRKSDHHIRISTQLVRASDGSNVWSHTYDRDDGDLFAIQDHVATAVAGALKLKVEEPIATSSHGTSRPSAYRHFLQGRFFFNRRDDGDMDRALEQYRLALHEDPDYARAWAAIAGVHRARMDGGSGNRDAELASMEYAVERALALDPQLPEAHLRATNYYMATGQRDEAWQHYYEARKLDPNAPLVLGLDAEMASWRGQDAEAARLWQRIVDEDPLNPVAVRNLAGHLVFAGRYEEATTWFQRVARLAPGSRDEVAGQIGRIRVLQGRPVDALASIDNLPASRVRDAVLAMAEPAAGRRAESEAAMARLASRRGVGDAVTLAEVHAHLGHEADTFEWLQRARSRAGPGELTGADGDRLKEAYASPFLRALHDDPRWDAWVASLDP